MRTFDIPAGALDTALTRFARSTGINLSYDAATVAGLSTRGLSGNHGVGAGLSILLAGSGLEAVAQTGGGYSLRKAAVAAALPPTPAPTPAPAQQMLPAIVISANAESPDELPRPYAGGQVARGGRLGVLGNLDYMETPFTTINITSQAIQNEQARTIGAVLNNDPSFQREWPGGSFADRFSVRGFGSSETINGLIGLDRGLRTTAELFERIEILKGPSALLYNGSAIGGNVGLVTKHADDRPLAQSTLSYASSSQFGVHADVGRRFGEDNDWGLRVNGVYRDGDVNIDHVSDRLKAGSLALDYRGQRLRASVDGLVDRNHITASRSQIYWDREDGPLPRPPKSDSNTQQPWEFESSGGTLVIGRVEYDVLDAVTAYAAVGRSHGGDSQWRGIPGNYQPDGTFDDGAFRFKETSKNTSGETGARWTFATGPLVHALTAAYAATRSIAHSRTQLGDGVSYQSNLYDPVIQPRPPEPELGPRLKTGESKTDSAVLTDAVSMFNKQLQVIGGIRRQRLRPTGYDADLTSPTLGAVTQRFDEKAWSPAVGVVWRARPWLSVYGNYIQGLELGPQAPDEPEYVNRNQLFPPTKTKQEEVGIKIDHNGLGLTLALFRIAQPNGRDTPVGNGQLRFDVDGRQVNRGVEFSAFGEPVRGWRLFGGVSYLDPRYDKTQDGALDGQRVPGFARWSTNLSSEYDVPPVPGLTLTARVAHKTRQTYDPGRSIASWTRYDVGARYGFKAWQRAVTVRAGIENVADKNYWESAGNGLLLAAPRTVLVSATVDF